jgi:hypothetical protein
VNHLGVSCCEPVWVGIQYHRTAARAGSASQAGSPESCAPESCHVGVQAEGVARFVEFVQLSVGTHVRGHVTLVSEQADAGKRIDWSAALSLVFKVGLGLGLG